MKSLTLSLLVPALLSLSLHAEKRPAVRPPLMGWSSWNTYHVDISDSIIRSQVDAMTRHGLKEAGYRYINIDDGFFGRRDSQGRLLVHATRFPDGLKPVVDYIHAKGFKAGIYSEAGSNTCGSIWQRDTMGVGSGLYGHEEEDMRFFMNDCGFDFIKVDYCGAQRQQLDEHLQYTRIGDALRATGRKDLNWNICRWAYPGAWARGLADSWRTTGDITATWKSVKDIIEENLYLSAFGGEGGYNDMDMLEVGRGLSDNEEEVHFGLWCMLSSPLLIGCDMNKLPQRTLSLITNPELIAINQDAPLLQACVVQHKNGTYVLAKDLQKRGGKVRAVAFYNPGDEAREVRVSMEELELAGRVRVRDLVERKDMDPLSGEIVLTLPPRSVRIWKLQGRRLEAVRYEGEWAFLPCYNEIGKGDRIALSVPDEAASGGMKVAGLGGRPMNDMRWDHVYSKKGGDYKMTIRYSCDEPCDMVVTVNGVKHELTRLNPTKSGGLRTVTLPVFLGQRWNEVRIGNPSGPAPDIDCFFLKRQTQEIGGSAVIQAARIMPAM